MNLAKILQRKCNLYNNATHDAHTNISVNILKTRVLTDINTKIKILSCKDWKEGSPGQYHLFPVY